MKVGVKSFLVLNGHLYYTSPDDENALHRLDLANGKAGVFEASNISFLHKDLTADRLIFSDGRTVSIINDNISEIEKKDVGLSFRNDLFFLFENKLFIQELNKGAERQFENFHLIELGGAGIAKASLPFQMPAELKYLANKLYFKRGVHSGRFACFDLGLNEIWSRDFLISHKYKNILNQEEEGRVDETFLASDKHACIVLMVWGSAFVSLEPNSGKVIWEVKIKSDRCLFCFDEDYIYAFDYNQDYYIISIKTGEIVYQKEVRSDWKSKGVRNLFTQFSKHGNSIYFCVSKPTYSLVQINAKSGEVINRLDLDTQDTIPEHFRPIITFKHILQYDGNGQLHIIDKSEFTYVGNGHR